MRLLFKQRMFSWFDSYDIYNENGQTVFTVEGQFGWGHRLHILDSCGRHIGTLRERVISFLPVFEIYEGDTLLGTIRKELTLFRPRFTVDCRGWQVQGHFMEWDYEIFDRNGLPVAAVSKELFRWKDTYSIDVPDPANALHVLMVVLAIDAEKCSGN
jgi:uncharacterized protein YxjI